MLEEDIDRSAGEQKLTKTIVANFKIPGDERNRTITYSGYIDANTKKRNGPGMLTWFDENGAVDMTYVGMFKDQ
jgi:hypothetical protein